MASTLSSVINGIFSHHQSVEVGGGILIPLQKPNKPLGPPSNLRPIVLLTSLRKALSLITLARIRPKVEEFLAETHSDFRSGRSTSDVVWAHTWLAAKAQRFHWDIHILGIDLSKAFDTIRLSDVPN